MRSEHFRQRIQFVILVLIVSVALSAGGIVLTNAAFGDREDVEAFGTLRLQVIPHSDRPADQDLKLFVRDRLLAALLDRVAEWGDSVGEVAERLEEETPWIARQVTGALEEAGSDLPFRITVDRLPAAEDHAGSEAEETASGVDAPGGIVLRIILGDGRGSNFWCVIFPNICFVPDEVHTPIGSTSDGSVAEAAPLREEHPDEPIVITQEQSESDGVQFRFRLFERIGATLRNLWSLVAGNPDA